MLTKPKMLNECGNLLVIDDSEKDRYQIQITESDNLLIVAGAKANSASGRFTHPNIVKTAKRIHEFKHYRDNGSKFWTSNAGIDHYFIVPKSVIKMLPEKGYSYIKAEINGVKVTFNVSGGTNNGWTDYLYPVTHISCGHKVKDLKKIAEVAIRNPELESKMEIKELEPENVERWEKLCAKANAKLKEKICKMIEAGEKPIIKMDGRYSFSGINQGIGIEVSRRAKQIPEKVEAGEKTIDGYKIVSRHRTEYTGAVKTIYLSTELGKCRAKVNQINWNETAKLNKIA